MFSGLTRSDIKGKVIPGLAKNWNISQDGKTYTFYLRDAKWSDGKPITAHDFEFAMKRILKPETAAKYSFMLHPIVGAKDYNEGKGDVNAVGVKSLDDTTFQITLNEPLPYFLEQLTHQTAFALPQHVVQKYPKTWSKKENIVVSGAFTLQEWAPQASVTILSLIHI